MKLKIEDYFWAVGHKTKKIKTVYAHLSIGYIEQMGNITRWHIDDIGDGFVKLSVIRHDGKPIKSFTVEKGKSERWRPRSMDARHEYKLSLVRFF